MTSQAQILLFEFFYFLFIVIYFTVSKKIADKKYKNPLRKDIERLPGHSLDIEIYDQSLTIIRDLMSIPIICIALAGLQQIKSEKLIQLIFISFIIVSIILLVKTIRLYKKRNNFILGKECEIVVGQDLNELKQWGYYVLHDFQATNYNIDHIIIGPSGLYIVETKGRRKIKGLTNAHKLYYNGKRLKFPDNHIEQKPIEQAKANANTLTQWIYQNTGKKYKAKAILAFPGWNYVLEKKLPEDAPMIFSGKNTKWIKDRTTILNQQQIWELYQLIRKRCLIVVEETKLTVP